MSERVCLYAGSFDPLTCGHLDVIRRACDLFDRVIIAVAHNPGKKNAFTLSERIEMVRLSTAGLNTEVVGVTGLTVTCAREYGAKVMIRGLRAASDFESERMLAQVNRSLAPEIETLFLVGAPEHSHISSSAVREMASYGCSLKGFVPEENEQIIEEHYRTKN